MSYESKLDNQTNKFFHPTQLTLIISLILHLLVYKFGLPVFNFKNDSGRREVSLIELTPEQESRLPNLYPQLDIPEIPNTPLDSAAPPFALPPSLTPGIEGLPPLPPIIIPSPPNFNIPPFPPIPTTDIRLPPIGDSSSLPLPPPLESLDSEIQQETKTPTTAPSTPTTPKTEEKPPQAAPKPETKPQPSPEQIAAKRQQNLQQKIRRVSSSLQKRETGTTDEDARKNYVAWLNEVKAIEPEALAIEGIYPRDACIRKLEGTSVYGVVTDAQGKVVALDLIKGAKYPIFNEQASKDISDRTFNNNTQKPKPYRVTVNYKYDAEICPSLTLPSLRRDDKPKTPEKPPASAPAPKPEATETAKPQPAATEKPPAPAQPSLRDRLRDVPLPNRKPSELERTTLPNKPRLRARIFSRDTHLD